MLHFFLHPHIHMFANKLVSISFLFSTTCIILLLLLLFVSAVAFNKTSQLTRYVRFHLYPWKEKTDWWLTAIPNFSVNLSPDCTHRTKKRTIRQNTMSIQIVKKNDYYFYQLVERESDKPWGAAGWFQNQSHNFFMFAFNMSAMWERFRKKLHGLSDRREKE